MDANVEMGEKPEVRLLGHDVTHMLKIEEGEKW